MKAKIALLSQKTALWLVLAALAAGCSPKIDNRGYVANAAWSEVRPGITTKEELLAAFGSPSSQSSFGEESWYYVAARKETVAFLKPEVAEQQVTRVTFDERGVVKNVEAYDKTSAQEFEVAKRITPTEGHQLGFFEQLLGNIGRFNKGGDTGVAPGRRPGGDY